AEISYTHNDSDAKVGQFFLKNEHAAGISASAATGFLTEKGEVIPFEPKDKALAKLKEYRDGVTKTYEEKKADYVAHHFDASAFEQYRSQRAAARRAGFDQCMQ
ncbi:TonB-dependent siderophore receptor, partial [Neisseria sp. P0014.S006]